MERGVRRKSHAPCEAGEKLEITSNAYLSLLSKGVSNADASKMPVQDTYKYLILQPNCKLYSRWDDPASLIF